MTSPLESIATTIRENDDFLVVSHVNPDGDAIGSVVALGHMLAAMGKNFTLYNASGMPKKNDWLTLPAVIEKDLPDTLPAWTIVMDCGSPERMGEGLYGRLDETRVVNIDHHLGNPNFGELNWVDVKQPAVGCMMALLADKLQQPLTGPLAEAVYLAVATDTGFFTYGSTTPECLELAATMLRNGLDMAGINTLITKQWSLNRLRLWTEVVGSVELFENQTVAVVIATNDMFQRTGTGPGATENVINFIRRLKTVRVSAILREEDTETFKFSLRSNGDDNVQAVAASFGGGGHKNAAGGTVHGTLEQARKALVERIAQMVELH
ncbi:DHH family phosphoesterase [Pseudodesulfovibrio senegalensis]|uniref:Bifunctional oligoribonuclease/PAP phosphatase NrnA n=1 Tax=Pseudodesulfovibrio senegalensis TaxID=1721087 RepID=A0A6N6N4J2_9BACT|nr:bifunctional oligoribonuclease/PAP phosphatase NrnA [Pseudodesulfovibrio senegalensis]KAB1442430.1 bifunctional oligoribonuclease/PAP phosphatase NrnA [Pseudodesulfovibrio senegalensis]